MVHSVASMDGGACISLRLLLILGLCMTSMVAAGAAGGTWGPAPASFDCGMRRMAYNFGKQLLPRLGRFEALYYALGLNEGCPGEDNLLRGSEVKVEAKLSEEKGEAIPMDALVVDPLKGSDAAAGTEEAPLRSLGAAVVKIGATQPDKPVILLRQGNHHLEAPLLLGAMHSGLSIQNFPGERPVISGGKRLQGLKWEPYNVSSGKNGVNIYRAHLAGQVEDVPGLQIDGVRATRARYPNLPGGIEVSPGYDAMIPSSEATWTPPDFEKFGPVKFHTDNTPAHFRNNTPDGWFQRYMIGVGGLCSIYDPPVGYWCSEHPSGGGAFAFRTPSGSAPKKSALPHAPYRFEKGDLSDMLMNIWRPERWANWMFQIDHYDAETNNFTFGAGGNQGARGNNKGGDFFVENVFEELDNPGEFFFDRKAGYLYLYHNSSTGGPPSAEAEVVVPQKPVLMNISGTQWAPVRNISISGLVFRAARYTYMEPHGVPSAGDWALDRIGAVFLQGTEDVKITGNSFERLDGNAVMISGYNRRATVSESDFAYIGGNAIASWGYTNETADSGFPFYTPNTNFPMAGVDGTDGNHPRYNRIIGNSVREVGLYEKQSSFYVQAKTAETTISGNVFFNGPRAGINFNDGFGGGDELSHNLVFSTCRESGDHGPFNSWDRQPYLTSVRTGEPSMVMAWREIHHNFLIDNYSPQENVDNDDGSAYYKTHHNFMVYGGQGMKNDFGGHDNRHFSNVYAYAGQAMGVDGTLAGHEDHFEQNKVVLTGTTVGNVMCNAPATVLTANHYFTPSGNITVCRKSLAEAQKDGLELGSTVAKTPADGNLLSWGWAVLHNLSFAKAWHGDEVEAFFI
mmetsp:Transcript_116850/g.239049  ORF Transcript_116850/g.239049 Transcript_116850/m.239049 type:complete len:851 (+) Transcript_116850:58-2610(+)